VIAVPISDANDASGRPILEAAGSSLEDVVQIRVFCTRAGPFEVVIAIYREYFPKDPPACTFVTVDWQFPFDIEVEAIAIA
jgi:2-iminobutanoate/2-iminopropanoate deaminase